MTQDANSNTALIESKLQILEKNKPSGKHWNISWTLGKILGNLVSLKQPKNILEFGTSNGFSTLWMAKNMPNFSAIYTIEVNDQRFDEAKINFESCKIKNITQLHGEAFEVLENYDFQNKFDFVFLDAAHKFYEQLIKELQDRNLLTEDCTIVADNVISHNMAEFIDFMKKDFNVEIIDIDSGFLVAKRKTTSQ